MEYKYMLSRIYFSLNNLKTQKQDKVQNLKATLPFAKNGIPGVKVSPYWGSAV